MYVALTVAEVDSVLVTLTDVVEDSDSVLVTVPVIDLIAEALVDSVGKGDEDPLEHPDAEGEPDTVGDAEMVPDLELVAVVVIVCVIVRVPVDEGLKEGVIESKEEVELVAVGLGKLEPETVPVGLRDESRDPELVMVTERVAVDEKDFVVVGDDEVDGVSCEESVGLKVGDTDAVEETDGELERVPDTDSVVVVTAVRLMDADGDIVLDAIGERLPDVVCDDVVLTDDEGEIVTIEFVAELVADAETVDVTVGENERVIVRVSVSDPEGETLWDGQPELEREKPGERELDTDAV